MIYIAERNSHGNGEHELEITEKAISKDDYDEFMARVALHWEKDFEYGHRKYNRIYREELPQITSHVCQYTFCLI